MIMRFVTGLISILTIISVNSLYAQSEEELVINTIQKFFDAMEKKDTVAMKEVLYMEGQFFSIRGESDDLRIRKTTHKDYLNSLARAEDDYLETMRAPMIHIHGRIAIVWTNYDFYLNKEFSHTGVDAFSLIKTETGWKIAGTIYTVESKK